jgi:hypothetical protein
VDGWGHALSWGAAQPKKKIRNVMFSEAISYSLYAALLVDSRF